VELAPEVLQRLSADYRALVQNITTVPARS
jgi:hypothetical protein